MLLSLFCVLFGAVYENYSHGVYSGYMIYAFVFPLVGGTLPFAAMSLYKGSRFPGRLPMNLYNAGIAALTVGSLLEGVLEIYGTSNDLLQIYWAAGFGFAALGFIFYFIGLLTSRTGGSRK